MKFNAIGLVGGLASGKDSLGGFIQNKHGGELVSTSNVAREYILENNLGEPTRDLTRETASKLRACNGADYLLRKSIENIPQDELAIVSGLYVVEEVICLRAIRNCIIVNVETSLETREFRATKRSRSSDESNPLNFHRLNKEDMHGSTTDQRLESVIKMADISVIGDTPIINEEYWSEQVDRIFTINNTMESYVQVFI